MKHIVLFFSLLLSLPGFAQDKEAWSAQVKGNAKMIFFHQFTQTPLIETTDAFYGVDPSQRKLL